jgi:hypothetical protein
VGGRYFVSYSRADGRSVALRLVDRLAGHRLGVDVRDMCRAALPDRLPAGPGPHRRRRRRRGPPRRAPPPLDSPAGVLQDLLLRLDDAERELARTADARRELVEQDIGRPTRADQARTALLTGTAAARHGRIDAAVQACTEAVARAEEVIGPSPGTVDVLDVKALAHTALALVGAGSRTDEAITAFRAARARSAADGVVRRDLRDLDTLAPLDRTGLLATVRPTAAGR